ncbi:MAG: pilus assembly protein TadG-related protein [Xanthobacteraceae bacterium]|jgi:Flp pilus assembly protein TadG
MLRSACKSLAISFSRVRTLADEFGSATRGNSAIIFAIAALPIISAVGCVIDYSYASMIKTKLQAAADAATLATVSNNSPIVTTAKSMSGSGSVSGGSTYLTNFFNEDTSAFTGISLTPTPTVTKTGQSVAATATFSYAVPTYFLKIMGYSTITVSGTSTASFTLPTYIDFYLMLDVSGSMSFPSTTAEQQRLLAVNPDNLGEYPGGCQFACHFTSQNACGQSTQGPTPAVGKTTNPNPGGYCQGFIISRLGTNPTSFTAGTTNTTNGNSVNWNNSQVSTCATAGTTSCIQLRADAVGYAVTALLTQATTTETSTGISNQFRVGLFPFIQYMCSPGNTATGDVNKSNSCSVGLTTSLSGTTITNFAQQLANLLDTGVNTTLGSGGTHFENALSTMGSYINSVGTGSGPTNTLPYVFIVSDGSQDYQTQSGGNWGSQNWNSNGTSPYQNSSTGIPPNSEDNTDYCQAMKSNGITVAVLYIPYGTIVDPNASFANNEDGYANTNITNGTYAANLQNCATTGFFYTASTPTDIQNALVTMFEQAVATAHISH